MPGPAYAAPLLEPQTSRLRSVASLLFQQTRTSATPKRTGTANVLVCALWLSLRSIILLIVCWWGLSLTASPAKETLRQELSTARRNDQIISVIQSWLPRLVDEEDIV
jgi:hypothetical protein